MANAPLSPVTITDRNGVVTTRHKKTATTKTPARALPAPKIPCALTDEQVHELLVRFRTRKGTSSTELLGKAIRKLSQENYAKMNDLLDAPVLNKTETNNARMYLGLEMLSKPSSVGRDRMDIGWKLDVSLALAHGSTMNSTHFLLFANTVASDERFSESLDNLPEASAIDRQRFCNIATAVTEINNYVHEQITNLTPREDRSGFIGGHVYRSGKKHLAFKDPTVFEALLDNPDHAARVTDLYRERGSLEALDEVLSVPSSIAEGAL